jgi:hypothetical protein
MNGLTMELRQRRDRWTSFLRADAPSGFLFLVRKSEPDWPARPPLWPEHQAARVEWIWDDYSRHLARMEWLHDDLVPSLCMSTGTEIFAEAFGCRVHRPSDNMPFALPLIRSPSEVERVKVPELSRSSLAYLFDMADELRRRAGPEAVFRMVDMQSPMDIAALVMEKSAFFVAMLEAPEAVKELALKTRELLTAFLDEWFRRYGVSFVAHHPDYYMPRGITLSEDEIGAVNTDMFEEFFLPELNALSDRYGGIGIHCCACARHQWDGLARLRNARLLNIANPHQDAAETYAFFARTAAQMHHGIKVAPPEELPGQYPADARVVIETGWIAGREEAERAAGALEALKGVGGTRIGG